MTSDFIEGDFVQTPFGKGLVREIRNNGRVLVDVRGRSLIFKQHELSPAAASQRRSKSAAHPAVSLRGASRRLPASEIDLHGMTVERALERAAGALDDALLGDLQELRFIHGKSGGRIRSALHGWLKAVTSVRSFRVDPQNEGVTIVSL